jgi:hypothetical protein
MMAYGTLGEYRRRRRRAALWRMLQFVAFVAVIVGTGTYAYQVGVSASEATAIKLEDDLERFQRDNLALRDRLAADARRVEEAQHGLRALRQRYDADIPKGALRTLLGEVERQLEDGVDPERLALLIELAGRPARCSAEPDTKRFMMATPVALDVVNAVRFGEGRIVVTGQGDSARNDNGLAEAWFDPAAPVRLTFRTLGGESEDVSGPLPLRHRMVVDDVEYRFSAVAGERAFVEITAQACAISGVSPEADPDPESAAAESRAGPDLGG